MIVIQIRSYGFNSMVSTPGVRECFASFLTDEEVANASSTCKAAHRNLLGDAIWKQRFVDLQIKLFQQSILSPQQTGFYARYSNAITYARGVDQSLKVTEMFVDSWFCFPTPIAMFESEAREFPKQQACMFVLMPLWASGEVWLFQSKELPWMVKLSAMPAVIFSVCHLAQSGYVYGKKFRVIQNIGGATSVMRKKVVVYKERTKGCLKNCRVTTCWQAVSRGMHRLRSWMWGGHED